VDARTGELVVDLGGLVGPTWIDDNTIAAAVAGDGKPQFGHLHLDQGQLIPDDVVIDRVVASADHDTGKQQALLYYDDARGTAVQPFDLATNAFGPTIPVHQFISMANTRSGDRIAISADDGEGVHIYDGTTGAPLGSIDDLGATVFITVADQVFIGSRGGALTQYDLATLAPISTLGGSRGFIQEAAGTADGAMLATNSLDRSVRLYDVAAGVSLGTPITIANDEANTMTLSLDGKRLAVGGEPGDGEHAIQIWDLDPGDWVEAACRLAGRNLTRAEWATNVGDLAPYRATCPGLPVDA
jgi:WD40 repeat protein